MDLERNKAYEELSELYCAFLNCHFPGEENFMIEPLVHFCTPVSAGPTEGAPNGQPVEISPALIVFIVNDGSNEDKDTPVLICGRKASEPGTEARALSDARRAHFPEQAGRSQILQGILEGLPPIPMVIVDENRICAFPAAETQLCSPVEYPSMLDPGLHDWLRGIAAKHTWLREFAEKHQVTV